MSVPTVMLHYNSSNNYSSDRRGSTGCREKSCNNCLIFTYCVFQVIWRPILYSSHHEVNTCQYGAKCKEDLVGHNRFQFFEEGLFFFSSKTLTCNAWSSVTLHGPLNHVKSLLLNLSISVFNTWLVLSIQGQLKFLHDLYVTLVFLFLSIFDLKVFWGHENKSYYTRNKTNSLDVKTPFPGLPWHHDRGQGKSEENSKRWGHD